MSVSTELAEFVAGFYDDPLGFVIAAYPWDSDPQLQIVELKEPWKSRYPNCKFGPDEWACGLLDDLGAQVKSRAFDGKHAVPPIRIAVSSGHGIGKSALSAWLIDWIMSTRPFAKGTITATTNGQLESRTWAQIATWTKKCITADWFAIKAGKGSMRLECKESVTEWFATAQSCRKENSEAFAGQHAASSTSFYLFDEGSGIESVIYEVAEGGLTDGEPMFFVFGNPTRNSGSFYDIFHKHRDQWTTYKIDSRQAQITNKAMIEEWKQVHGEDSDFFRVRVRGEFPNASTCQFIPQDIVDAAMARPSQEFHPGDHPIAIVGVDIAMYGDDTTSICTRVGREVLGFKTYRKRGLEVCGYIQEHVSWLYETYGFKKVYVFMDCGGVGMAHVDLMKKLGYTDVVGINFGAAPQAATVYKNRRAEMWGRMRDWLRDDMPIIPRDDDLMFDLTGPEYFYDTKQLLQLESKDDMKARGLSSPDKADSLALTFAERVFEPPSETIGLRNRAAEQTRKSRMAHAPGVRRR